MAGRCAAGFARSCWAPSPENGTDRAAIGLGREEQTLRWTKMGKMGLREEAEQGGGLLWTLSEDLEDKLERGQ